MIEEEFSEDNSKKRKNKKIMLVVGVVLFAVFVLLYGEVYIRRYNIEKNMEKVYSSAEFVEVKCNDKPVSKSEIVEKFSYQGIELPEDKYYSFLVVDSDGKYGRGYATKYGKVIIDSYSNFYYAEDWIETFRSTLDFDNDFSGVECCFSFTGSTNRFRYVFTEDCTTFEKYKNARTTVYTNIYSSSGFTRLMVAVDGIDKENMIRMKQMLMDAKFDMYVEFYVTKDGIPEGCSLIDEENAQIMDEKIEIYHPYGEEYEKKYCFFEEYDWE